MATTSIPAPPAPQTQPLRPHEDALRRLAHGDAARAHTTRSDRLAFATWLAVFVLGCAFLVAVGASVALDAAGLAF